MSSIELLLAGVSLTTEGKGKPSFLRVSTICSMYLLIRGNEAGVVGVIGCFISGGNPRVVMCSIT